MRFVSGSLYVKTILWMLLNLLLLAVLGVAVAGYAMLGAGYDGVLPASLFSARSDSVLRVVSANLQYRPVREWMTLVKPHAERLPVRMHFETLDTESILDGGIPDKMVAQAKALPRATYTFCPEPEVMLWDSMGSSLFMDKHSNAEYGLPPVPPALFRHTSEPSRFWLGRIMYIPDNNRQIHTVLVALESESPDGNGLFFDIKFLLVQVAAILGVSFLWWIPFVRHLSRPLRRMARYAEEVEADRFANIDRPFLKERDFTGARMDEIGRLGHALASLTRRMNQTITGQGQFIRYVAHELNTPIAKAQMHLGVLECTVDEANQSRVQKIQGHIKRLSILTDEVLSYLQAKASMNNPKKDWFNVRDFLELVVQNVARGQNVKILSPAALCLFTDRTYLYRSVSNLLRNAVHYAGSGPIILSAGQAGQEICVAVSDSGPGVPEEDLSSLTEAFFRGHAALTHPGGTGLGLSIVKYCTESCGGRMEYGNRESGGFEVRLFFPGEKTSEEYPCCSL